MFSLLRTFDILIIVDCLFLDWIWYLFLVCVLLKIWKLMIIWLNWNGLL